MLRLDPTVSTLSVAGVLAIATSVMLNWAAASIGQQMVSGSALAADAPAQRPVWAASSTGRVEPIGGEVRITSEAPGKIVEVIAKTNEPVAAGDLLVRLDDDELIAKHRAAVAEAEVRERERDEEPVKGLPLEMHQVEDAAAVSERALFRARNSLDDAFRDLKAGKISADALTAAREKLATSERKAADDRAAVERTRAKDGMPLPTRLESSLTIARADITQVENAIEKTRIRAPAAGTVLNVWARVGEQAMPSPEAPLVLFGDISSLRVRAEVEERDVVKVKIGQRVVVRADAFPDRDFEGVVTQLAPALGPPRITTRGPRRPNDVEVLEVLITLDGQPPLLTGMRVDAFFKSDSAATADTTPARTQVSSAGAARK
jgi:HlyD family secretion protein